MRIGQGSPGNALTLAYLPLGVFVAALLLFLLSLAAPRRKAGPGRESDAI